MAIRLRDIAKKAGVSLQAVSVVVNNSKSTSMVGEKTRRRILRVAQEMGYLPNAGARAMRRGTFNRIALVVTRYVKGRREAGWSNLPSYLDTAVDVLADRGYSLIFEPFDLDWVTHDFIEPPRLFSELNVDGILAIDTAGLVLTRVDERISEMGSPVVWINRNPGPGYSTVMVDELAGSRMLTHHLLDLGHRGIGYVGPDADHYACVNRAGGVREMLLAANLDPYGIKLMPRNGQIREVVNRVLDLTPRITGLICYNHIWYDAALAIAANRGLRVPQDVSLCYFASPWEMDIQLFATGLQIPEIEMTRLAVEILLGKIAGRDPGLPARLVAGELRVGDTTGPAPKEDGT